MKLKRKGGLTAGIITLSAVALTSVGFAAWVISAGDTATVAGNIEVDTVSDDSHTIIGVYDKSLATGSASSIAGTNNSNQSIRFGAPVDKDDSSSKWLSYSRDTESDPADPVIYESLEATYYVCVLNGTTATADLDDLIRVGFEVVEPNNKGQVTTASTPAFDATYTGFTGAKSAVGSLYMVELPTVKFSVVSSGTDTLDTNASLTAAQKDNRTWFKVDIAFSWGNLWKLNLSAYDGESTYAVGALIKRTVSSVEHVFRCKKAITEAKADFDSDDWEDRGAVGNGNPYYYYNARLSNEEITDTHSNPTANISAAAHANKYLGALKTLLAGVSYSMTFKTYANTEEFNAGSGYQTAGNLVVANTVTAA